MDVFDAAMRYKKEGRDLIVLAGKDYGSGSSRDWAAKGPWMLVRPLLLYRFVTFICDWHFILGNIAGTCENVQNELITVLYLQLFCVPFADLLLLVTAQYFIGLTTYYKWARAMFYNAFTKYFVLFQLIGSESCNSREL